MSTLGPGSILGGYRILARLRAGSMGVLYLARRVGTAEFSRPVAIKVIHDHLAQNARFCRMFVAEARLSARIDHPNVVRVEEFGNADGRFYLVMEYVQGVSLAQIIGVLQAGEHLPIEYAVAIAIAMAGGLHSAHEATDETGAPLGIVHRDVSPHNVLLSYTGAVRLIDFGIAKTHQAGGQTMTGSLRGKLAYMPPEQAKSARTVDRTADLYGLGLVLWEMLTFRRVFDAEGDVALMNQVRNPIIVPPSSLAPAVPTALDDVILYTLALDPEERPRTGLVLQRALADALPAALRVMPSDLAALVMKVRAKATSLAEGHDDPSGLYGEEVRRTLTVFGKEMHPDDPTAPGLDSDRAIASVIVETDRRVSLDDDTTIGLQRAAVAPPVAAPAARPWPPPPELSPIVPAPGPIGNLLSARHKVVIAVVGPIAAASLIGIGIVVGGRGDPSTITSRPAPSTVAPELAVAADAAETESLPPPPPAFVVAEPPAISPRPPERGASEDAGARRTRSPLLPAGLPRDRNQF